MSNKSAIELYPNNSSIEEVLVRLDERWDKLNSTRVENSVYLTGCATTDITQPYHSLSYLVGALSASDIPSTVRDLGIEFWNYLISPAVILELSKECFSRADTAPPDERRHFLHLHRLFQKSTRYREAFDVLRRLDSFYDSHQYIDAVKELNALPRLLSLLSHSSEYRTFGSASPPGYHEEYIDLKEMKDVIKKGLGSPILDKFYDHHAALIAAENPIFVGFTVPFLSQLEHTLFMGSKLRERGIETILGGPMAAKFIKYANKLDDIKELNYAFDYIVTGEGESVIVDLARALKNNKHVVGLRNLVPTFGEIKPPRLFFENVNTLPSPDYGIWDYDLYASPIPGALYSPTRGCYWNKCAFCDYGLAVDAPTSPWRIRSPEVVLKDLEAAEPYVSRFFFAVDVLSPSYAIKLSNAMIESGQNVKWMADFRLESSFDTSKVSIFKESGCIGAAFGMESADQDTLDSIDKGTDVTRLSNVVEAFSSVGIPVQLMGFTGFPGETMEQANRTFDTASDLLGSAATVALGKFGLSKGSLVAKKPQEFDVEILYEHPDLPAIPWDMPWRLKKNIEVYPEDDFSGSFKLLRGFPYPFLGATSTHHSLLYFEKNDKPPFNIPWWHYESLLPGPFYVIPHYFITEIENELVLESALTGRIMVIGLDVKELLETLFENGKWWKATKANLEVDAVKGLLDFLCENSLVMFHHVEDGLALLQNDACEGQEKMPVLDYQSVAE